VWQLVVAVAVAGWQWLGGSDVFLKTKSLFFIYPPQNPKISPQKSQFIIHFTYIKKNTFSLSLFSNFSFLIIKNYFSR
jgi:hypothetical protein